MLKADTLELQRHELFNGLGMGRLRVARSVEYLLKILERDFGFTIDVYDVSQFLKRSKDVERIDHQREKLPNRNLLAEYQVEHQKQNTGAQRIDRRPLYETQTAQVLHFFEFELKNLVGDTAEAFHLLMGQSQALHQFNITQRLCG